MRRDFLKELGIEDKEIIGKILDENSQDIGKAKGDLEDVKSKLIRLQIDFDKKVSEYDALKESTKDYESLTTRINELELEKNTLATEKSQLKIDLDNKVSEIQKTHAIENSVRDANAKNVKAVMALLDMDKITYESGELKGVTEQLETLTTGEDTSFLFGSVGNQKISGATPQNPPNGGNNTPPTSNNLAEAIKKAMSK